MQNVIKKIELDLKGKKITLTLEQMKMLKEALDDMFEKKVICEYPYQPYQPCYPFWYYQPQYWYSSTDYIGSGVGNTVISYSSETETLRLTG